MTIAPTTEDGQTPVVGNGATSMHLWWDKPPPSRGAVRAVSVDLEVLKIPTANKLYFWALQGSFRNDSGSERSGGAHIGLQYHPSIPGNRGANWGGYDHDGSILQGSRLAIPSSLGCKNTGDFAWEAGSKYRITIGPHVAPGSGGDAPGNDDDRGGWPGRILDLATGREVLLRRLYATGPVLEGAVMWSEVFGTCNDPSVCVRWSGMAYYFQDGSCAQPETVAVNYQTCNCGSRECAKTNAFVEPTGGVCQQTSTKREVAQGTKLQLRGCCPQPNVS